jgi:hypothetical protein
MRKIIISILCCIILTGCCGSQSKLKCWGSAIGGAVAGAVAMDGLDMSIIGDGLAMMAGSAAGGAIGEAIDKADSVPGSKQTVDKLDSKPMTPDNVKPCMPCVAEEVMESEEN